MNATDRPYGVRDLYPADRAAAVEANSTDVVGYAFQAYTYCPCCINGALTATPAYEGWAIAQWVGITAEDDLNEIALAFGVNRHDEASYDSDTFPKVIFADETVDSYCGMCGDTLTGAGLVLDGPRDYAPDFRFNRP